MLKEQPARFIETLPNYRRPSLLGWMNERGVSPSHTLTLGDLMDLGFDPTRLKEITINGKIYIIDRMQAKQSYEIKRKQRLLEDLGPRVVGIKCRGAFLKTMPPLSVIRDRGNAYILRRKIPGIHWDEAIEQLRIDPRLKDLNRILKLDRLLLQSVREAREQITQCLKAEDRDQPDLFTWFVSWDLKNNRPRLAVDASGAFFETLWIA